MLSNFARSSYLLAYDCGCSDLHLCGHGGLVNTKPRLHAQRCACFLHAGLIIAKENSQFESKCALGRKIVNPNRHHPAPASRNASTKLMLKDQVYCLDRCSVQLAHWQRPALTTASSDHLDPTTTSTDSSASPSQNSFPCPLCSAHIPLRDHPPPPSGRQSRPTPGSSSL